MFLHNLNLYIDRNGIVHFEMKQWYVQRFFKLQSEAFQNKQSHFYQYKDLSYEETQRLALDIWQSINEINIKEKPSPLGKRAIQYCVSI